MDELFSDNSKVYIFWRSDMDSKVQMSVLITISQGDVELISVRRDSAEGVWRYQLPETPSHSYDFR